MQRDTGYAYRIADAVRDQRLRLELSQGEVAKRAGVSRHLVSDLESAKATGISLQKLSSILDVLGMSLAAKVGVPVSNARATADNALPYSLTGKRHVF